ncbi:SigE family RNA polymerase sigma factor [Actinoplanes sp. L3-i22]|uniref:SigE family RNA polymerase sigma factor n=1 Tax=Actinoplanes sp. L3-i22 TaxID=2836373 RepID=UPI001C765AA1|nr:SigE family RNA polymerase sigma factor [Actinoplanes sp. L3-i22]BCY10856.1 RNA polymerase sigma24 factor [Actinoplanes sp. L3-i22]
MKVDERDQEFAGFVGEHRGRMLHTARLLTAGDAHLAEDLVQTALTKLYVSWAAFRRAGSPDAYVRRALFNALLDEKRRVWRRFERPFAEVPDQPGTPSADDGDPELARALGELPPRMRAAIVFRFVHDMDVADTARALGCSVGTVKSQTARALEKLRAGLDTFQEVGVN